MSEILEVKNRIIVPALADGNGNVIVPETYLGSDVEYRATAEGRHFTASQYQKFNPPTLAVLRRAFFDKNEDGSWLCPEYRKDVNSHRGYGEWTSTWVKDREEILTGVHFDEKGKYLGADRIIEVKGQLPPNKWVLEYDKETGVPSRTGSRKAAEKIFGNDASYVWFENGLCAVLRSFDGDGNGPFGIDAGYRPDYGYSGVGSRLSQWV